VKGNLMDKIRVLIGILGMDQHEVGAIAVSRIFRDAGMEVIYAGRFNLPAMILQMTLEEGADVIGLSCHSWEYLYYVPELLGLLKEKNLSVPIVVGGSVITPGDADVLTGKGVAAVFGPSAEADEIIETVKRIAG
jgi:methylmalonyl-CoA mutase C-terminal domain/subunit